METGFAEARGDYVLTLDADMSHDPAFVSKMWRARKQADIIIASRYVPRRHRLHRVRARLAEPHAQFRPAPNALDAGAGYVERLSPLPARSAGRSGDHRAINFEVQEEVLVKAFAQGFSVHEVPFTYFPREAGRSHARVLRFGISLAHSGAEACGRCAIPSRRRTTTIARSPASFRCSVTGSARAIGLPPRGRAAPIACWISDADRASSSRVSTTRSGWTSSIGKLRFLRRLWHPARARVGLCAAIQR